MAPYNEAYPYYDHKQCDHDADLVDTAACEMDSATVDIEVLVPISTREENIEALRLINCIKHAWAVLSTRAQL